MRTTTKRLRTASAAILPTRTAEEAIGKERNRSIMPVARSSAMATPVCDAPNPMASGVLQHEGAEKSAHETITAEQEKWSSIAQLAAEYETIAQAAQHQRFGTASPYAGDLPVVWDTPQTHPRLVEEEHRRRRHHAGGQVQAAAQSTRIGARRAPGRMVEVEAL